jgi:hypothetical protein
MVLSRFFIAGLVFSALGAMAGCSSAKDISALDVGSTESELRLSGTKYLGTISSGQTRSSHYRATPIYRSYGFSAKGGDEITVDVKSEDGDAVVWLTDSRYKVLATNDDATESSFDAHVTYQIPDGLAARSYRIVFREYWKDEANFDVTLGVKSAPATCSYDGQTYQPGDTFNANDSCNTCSCAESGETVCTKAACVCNPATEADRTYVGTPEQCMVIRYTCQTGQIPFSNGCGCGCETKQ